MVRAVPQAKSESCRLVCANVFGLWCRGFLRAMMECVLRLAPVFPIGRDHLDAVLLFQGPVQRIGIVRLVAGQPCRQFVEEAA